MVGIPTEWIEKVLELIQPKFEYLTYFKYDECEFEFSLFLHRVSQNRDRNSQKMAKIPSSDFMTKNIFNLTFFLQK